MTINEIVNSLDLMSRATKDQIELINNKDVSSHSNQLPSIVISSSTSRCCQNAVTVVGDFVAHQSSDISPVHSPTKSSTPVTSHLDSNMHSNSTSKHRPKLDSQSRQVQTRPQIQLDGLAIPHNLAQVPVSIDVCLDDSLNHTQVSDEAEVLSAIISRPTSLISKPPNLVSLSAPKPPEFSISPAESLSKASSNEQMSSSAFHLPTYKSPHSPSSLSVNFCKYLIVD